jgi:hypothetical protein
MKKPIVTVMVFLLSISIVGFQSSLAIDVNNFDESIEPNTHYTNDPAAWTYMMYFVGDMQYMDIDLKMKDADINYMIPAINSMELSGSTEDVNIILQADDYTVWGGNNGDLGGTRRYHIKHDEDINEFSDYTSTDTY